MCQQRIADNGAAGADNQYRYEESLRIGVSKSGNSLRCREYQQRCTQTSTRKYGATEQAKSDADGKEHQLHCAAALNKCHGAQLGKPFNQLDKSALNDNVCTVYRVKNRDVYKRQ